VKEKNAFNARRRRNQTQGGMHIPGMPLPDEEDKGPRIFQAQRKMNLPQAFEALEVDLEWLDGFKASGARYADIRYKWRKLVLKNHPDRQQGDISDEEVSRRTAEYMKAMSAFEAIDSYYATHHARPVEPLQPDAAAPTGGSERPKPRSEPHEVSSLPGRRKTAGAATERASRPMLLRRRVEVTGLKAKPEYNGRIGTARFFDPVKGRYAVELDGGDHPLQIKEANLKLLPEAED
jgi:hypothetical protein